jgi:putative membrane protein
MKNWQGSYCGPAPIPGDIYASWNFDPAVLLLLVVSGIWAGGNRPAIAAVLVLALVFVSPLCALSSALFSARVIHHVLLLALAAPLLALARPAKAAIAIGPAFVLATAALWLWHLPAAYDAALGHKAIYWVMQASLFGPAVWFWRAVFSQPSGSGALWVLFAYIAMGLLGALLSLAPDAIYASHLFTTQPWGMAPLADQQLGGLIMWMPSGLPFAVWGLILARQAWRDMGQAA